jgi:flagellar motor component MotA
MIKPRSKPAAARHPKTKALRELAQAMAELRQEAKEKGLDKLTIREINEIVIKYAVRKIRSTASGTAST